MLAESYLTRRSHRQLPRLYQNTVFQPSSRRALLDRRLQHFASLQVDVLCLQEVDMPLNVLKECGYDCIMTPTSKEGNGAGGRVDACGIYYLKEKWRLVDYELVRFDDLATLGSTSSTIISNLQGLSTSFLRRNVGVVCRLQHIQSEKTVVIANAHVYWNPSYEYVKLCQVHYMVQRAHAFSSSNKNEGVVFCGDLNSPQHSLVHEYLAHGKVNAKRVAPWYRHSIEEAEVDCVAETPQVEDQLAQLAISKDDESPTIRYMLDFTLNRFTRWLRILGIDAALETEHEEIERTRENNMYVHCVSVIMRSVVHLLLIRLLCVVLSTWHSILFDRCRDEKRTLVTTSYKLLLRKDCPSGTYLVNPKSLKNLEAAFVHLLLHHGVTLEPAKFLSRCVVCNGRIQDVQDEKDKQRVFAANNAPDLSDELADVYECNGCGQGYWWCDKPSSSATRVKSQATRLFELCLRGGVPIKGPLNMFSFVDVDKERAKGLEEDDIELEHLDVTDWMKDERLSCPIPLESSYALRDENGAIIGERLPFTNVTFDFVGALDYVMFDTSNFRPTERLYVPTSFKELNGRDLRNGHLLPSVDWPSDHLAVGVELEFLSDGTQQAESEASASLVGSVASRENGVAAVIDGESSTSEPDAALFCGDIDGNGSNIPAPMPIPISHPPRCACGCVPNVKSIFEMAELRKQARLKAAAAKRES